MKILQKIIGGLTSILCAFTIAINVAHPQLLQPGNTISAIVVAAICLIWFGSSIIWDKLFLRIGQVLMIAIVGILTICLNIGDYLPYSLMGMVLFFFAITLGWAYDLFDKAPLVVIAIAVTVLFLLSTLILNSAISGSAMTEITVAVAASFWAVVHTKIKRFRKMALDYRDLAKSIDSEGKHG